MTFNSDDLKKTGIVFINSIHEDLFVSTVNSVVDVAVGARMSEYLTSDQLDEFEKIIDGIKSVVDKWCMQLAPKEKELLASKQFDNDIDKASYKFLVTYIPDFSKVVSDTLDVYNRVISNNVSCLNRFIENADPQDEEKFKSGLKKMLVLLEYKETHSLSA